MRSLDRLAAKTQEVGWLHGPATALVRPIYRLLYPTVVTGTHLVPRDGPVVVAANHLSFFDTPVLILSMPRRLVFLGKAEYLDDWKTRRLFPALGMVPLPREAARSALAALEVAASLLRAGEMVGIYPEGTRSRDGLLHRGHSGVAHLALATGAPILPVGLIGTDDVQPIGQSMPRPRRRILVRFGEPLRPEDYLAGSSRRRRQRLTDDLMAAIAALTRQPQSPDFASDEPPLIRGGSETVYRVVRTSGLAPAGWEPAARAAVAETCRRYDDARIGEVSGLRCRIDPAGSFSFETDLRVSVKFNATGGEP